MDRLPDSKCDFCSTPNPEWAFPAQSFYHKTHVEPVDKFIHGFMREEWAACGICSHLIHTGKDVELTERIFVCKDVRESISAILYRQELLRNVMDFHNTFRRNRLQGPPVLIG